MSKKKVFIIAITIFFIGLIITAGSYAFWAWNSTTDKNVVFSTSNELKRYIEYDEGESQFVGDLQVANSYILVVFIQQLL